MKQPGKRPPPPASKRRSVSPLREAALPSRILVAIDDSTASVHALEWAETLAALEGARVTVLHVVPSPDLLGLTPAFGASILEPGILEAARRDGKRLLRDAKARLENRGVAVETRLDEGHPVRQIVASARKERADVIVLGAHGAGIVERMLIGSVAEGVKNHAASSVLLARSPARLDRVLAGLDGSEASARAGRLALALSRRSGARLTLLHASGHGRAIEVDVEREIAGALRESVGARADDETITCIARAGRPSAILAEEARGAAYGLVVVGARGVGALRSVVPGSTANALARESPCSVMIVKDGR